MAPPGTDTLSVHIDKNVFESYITSMMPRWHFADNNGVQVLELANKANSLSRYALTALCAGSDGWLTESDFLEGLVQELGRARVADQTEDKYNRLNNRKTLMRLIAYIEENINNNIIMLDLCNYCAISQSTLQRLFLKEFGITPYNYVQARRLELARQFLMSNVDGKTIAEIAARSGFSHFGRFSTAYRHQFGVLPSESRQIV